MSQSFDSSGKAVRIRLCPVFPWFRSFDLVCPLMLQCHIISRFLCHQQFSDPIWHPCEFTSWHKWHCADPSDGQALKWFFNTVIWAHCMAHMLRIRVYVCNTSLWCILVYSFSLPPSLTHTHAPVLHRVLVFDSSLLCLDVSAPDGARKASSSLSLASNSSLQPNGTSGFQRKRLHAPTLSEMGSSDSDVSVRNSYHT